MSDQETQAALAAVRAALGQPATLTITLGLPGSGKSTWARQQAGAWLVGRDAIRAMVRPGQPWDHDDEAAEDVVTAIQHAAVEALLRLGERVICDDTNLYARRRDGLAAVAAACGARFVVHDLRHVDVGLCIARDAGRPVGERVGKDAIRQMAKEAGL